MHLASANPWLFRPSTAKGFPRSTTPCALPCPKKPNLRLNLEERESHGAETEVIRVAVVGRPNAGKSTLINQLVGEERLLTGPEPGITREFRLRCRCAGMTGIS